MDKRIPLIFIFLITIYLIGFGIDIMDIDAAQYASMSREMLEHKCYLQLFDLGKDYLDKPPFLIWISALSMRVFGISAIAYRLPSLLFSLSAIWSTYKLAALFYNRSISVFATIILASCQAFFLMNNDVRTDAILMSFVIFSLWQLAAWFQNNKFYHFILGCMGIAGGLMTKGPVALLVPAFAFSSHFLLHRNFKNFFRWEYLAGVIIIGVLLLPMCIGLYRQFDLHPEKIINHRTAVSGLRFFFWTQSFGRITGESEWDNNSNILYLVKNMMWTFLPWILFFLIAFYFDLKKIVQQKFRLLSKQEGITSGGFILTYISLGLSKYQLPHYIFVVFPLASIITAVFFYQLIIEKKYQRFYKILTATHLVLFIFLWLALILLLCCFNTIPVFVPVSASILFIIFLFIAFYKKKKAFFLPIICLFTIMSVNLFLNSFFYPALLKYQMGSVAGKWLITNKIPSTRTFIYQYETFRSLSFYSKSIIEKKDSLKMILPGDWIITHKNKLRDFDFNNIKYDIAYQNNEFRVARLSLKFLNPDTRPNLLSPYVIIKIK